MVLLSPEELRGTSDTGPDKIGGKTNVIDTFGFRLQHHLVGKDLGKNSVSFGPS